STALGSGQRSQETVNRKQKITEKTVNQNQEKSIHRPCEGLKNKAFTLKTPENQAKVHTM
ncbi:MAG: hypothetical protein MR971_02935, partial [Bacteroidales bacterium]|nr:hypothetical protein [Bacteroidales bacterium]